MPPQLLALTEGPNILIDKPILLLGRHQECDIQLGSRKVSRRHCCVAQVNDHFVVRDLGSTNGIRINGKRVLEGSMKPGDELTIGNQRYQLDWASQAGRAALVEKAARRAKKEGVRHPDSNGKHHPDLESSDHPIPLPEPAVGGKLPPAAIPLEPAAGNGTAIVPHAPAAIVPDDLQIKPLSHEGQAPGQ